MRKQAVGDLDEVAALEQQNTSCCSTFALFLYFHAPAKGDYRNIYSRLQQNGLPWCADYAEFGIIGILVQWNSCKQEFHGNDRHLAWA